MTLPDPQPLRQEAEQLLKALTRGRAPLLRYNGYTGENNDAIYAEMEAAFLRQRQEALKDAQRAVVEACQACEGQGWTIGVETGYGHACDGTDANCALMCPVPEPVQVQERCEYCGRPSDAIRALATSDGDRQ